MSEPAVLRVLSGRLAGTAKPLPADGTVSIGHQYWQDVVIRDPLTKGTAVDLSLSSSGQAQISVLSGEAVLLGQTVAAGGTAILPAYVPFSIGGVSLAWGEPHSDRWSEAGGLVEVVPSDPSELIDTRAQAAAALDRARQGAAGLMTKRNGLVAAGVAAVAFIGFSILPALEAMGLRPDAPTRVDRALDGAGFTALTVKRTSEDDVAVTGVVTNESQRVRVQSILRDSGVPGTVDVQTSNELAQAAADVARGRGLSASARAVNRTAIELRTSVLTDDARTGLVQAVRADVRQIGSLTLRDDLPAPDEVAIKAVSDLTRKVSTVVAGDPAFIQTADGARYFAGAVMPSGHRLVGIEGNNVYLEKNGRNIRVTF